MVTQKSVLIIICAIFLYIAFGFYPYTISLYAQTLPPRENDSLPITITFGESTEPLFIELDQNTFIKTNADGFTQKNFADPDRFRVIGTAHLSWQPKGLYEIIIYTDNITITLPLAGIDPLDFLSQIDSLPAEKTASRIDSFAGLYLVPFPTSILSKYIPFKLWTQLTAGRINLGTDENPIIVAQQTAPNTNGIIDKIDFLGGRTIAESANREMTPDEALNPDPSYTFIPEKYAVNLDADNPHFGDPGGFKKVIAASKFGTKPFEIELTFAMDLANTGIDTNKNQFNEETYLGVVFIDLVGN